MDRDELHKRIMFLKEELEAGRVVIAPHLQEEMMASLQQVRYAQDGKVDPETVDSRVRATANAIM